MSQEDTQTHVYITWRLIFITSNFLSCTAENINTTNINTFVPSNLERPLHSCNLLVPDFVGWFKRCARQVICYISIDLYDVLYVFLYLYVIDIKLECGFDMC